MDTASKTTKTKRSRKEPVAPAISEREFAALGGGTIAYVRELTTDQASEMFPAIRDLPKGVKLFALHAADGTPIVLTDTRQGAIGQAIEDELEVRSLH